MAKQAEKLQQSSSSESQLVISPRQSGSIVASTILGVGVLTLPRVVASKMGEAGWIAVLCGACIAAISLFLVGRLSLRFPGKNILDYSQIIFSPEGKERSIWGYLLTIPIMFIYISFLLFSTALVKRVFGEVVVTSVLLETPLEIIILTMMITVYILTLYDIDVLARLNEILLPLIIVPILFIALFSFQNFRLEFLFPIWPNLSLKDVFMGIVFTIFSYQGFELLTVFSGRMFNSQKMLYLNQVGLAVPTFIYLLIVIASISVFGREELDILMWPTLELVKTTQVPGVILERMESAFLGVWVAAVFTTAANVYYAAIILISQLFRIEKYRHWVSLGIIPIIYWIALLPKNVAQLFEWQMFISMIGILFSIFMPAIFLIMATFRNKRTEELNEEKPS